MTLGQRFEMGYDIEPATVPLKQADTLPWVETIAAAADGARARTCSPSASSSLTTVSSFFVLVSSQLRPADPGHRGGGRGGHAGAARRRAAQRRGGGRRTGVVSVGYGAFWGVIVVCGKGEIAEASQPASQGEKGDV